MNRWQYIYFFDKDGKYYNFNYDATADMWTGDIYIPPVSVGLFEVAQLFILQEFIDSTTNTKKFGFPHSYDDVITGSTGSTGGYVDCYWEVEWETDDPEEILLFQFNMDFNTGTQSSLEMEADGPPLEKYDVIQADLDYDPLQTINADGYVVTNDIRSEVLQLNIAINAIEENTFKRTLIIRDVCTETIVAKLNVYAETVEEDERLRTMTENMGYNVVSTDSEIFRDTNIKEILPDFVEVNRKRKEIMLEGHNIYPFIGSYKGLVNAIKFFGYNNLQIKEFWKNVNKSSPRYGKYIQSNAVGLFEPTVNFNDMSITLPNKNFRKTSMFSLIYKINNITERYDDEDLPLTEEVFDFTIEEVLIKLFGLKRKLEKDFLPLNAHIKDITGEADFFGLLEVTNTISRNDKNVINAGIDADFEVTPKGCTYIQDIRDLEYFCLNEQAVIGSALVNYCNAYIAPFGYGENVNMLLGPISTGQPLPPPPIGPDLNGPFTQPYVDGDLVTVGGIADIFLAYFSRYAPNLNKVGYKDGYSSEYLPDKPGIPVGAPIVLNNNSFGKLTWDNIDSTWNQLSNANSYYTFDLNPQGAADGDQFIIYDPVSETQASYTAQVGDTDEDVRDALYTQLESFRSSFVSPWIFWDISKITDPIYGDSIRVFGNDVQRLKLSVIHASFAGSRFEMRQQPGDLLYTWDSILRGNFTEIEWTIIKDKTDVSPAYYSKTRGPLSVYETLPVTLPYVGTYTVEMKLFDTYNNISSKVKTDYVCVEAKEVEYSGWYQSRKLDYTWSSEGKYKWNDYGSIWNLPIEPSITWDEETPSLYESLDRVNAILNNFGLGTAPNFQLLNYQDDGTVSFSGPYQWKNLNKGNWNDTYHLWWDMTATSGDTPAFFEFREVVPNSYLKITNVSGETGIHYFDFSTTTLAQAASQLNLSTDPVINRYVYNVVYDATSQQKYVQAVCRYFGVHGDWKYIDVVDVNDDRICANYTTGVTGSTGYTGATGATGSTGCDSLIYRKGLSISNNPTWSTAKFINEGKTLPKMTWVMFVYDKCRIPGKKNPKWTIRNTSDSNSSDIYFESKYLTYLFQNPGKYEISLELTDTNGNKYKKGRNILIIK